MKQDDKIKTKLK